MKNTKKRENLIKRMIEFNKEFKKLGASENIFDKKIEILRKINSDDNLKN